LGTLLTSPTEVSGLSSEFAAFVVLRLLGLRFRVHAFEPSALALYGRAHMRSRRIFL